MAVHARRIQQYINQGVQAHQKGDTTTARLHFQAALREDPENIVILLWLAYIAPNYDKRIFLLNRVLDLDPNNERAQAGLAWAKKQQNASAENQSSTSPSPPKSEAEAASANPLLRLKQQFGTDELREQAKKGTIAQRARRRIGG